MEKQGFVLIEEKEEKRSYFALILSLFSVGGFLFCVQQMFVRMTFWFVPLLLAAVLSVVIFRIGTGKNRKIFLAVYLLILCVAFVLLRGPFLSGAMDWINQIIANVNVITGRSFFYFVVPNFQNIEIAHIVFFSLAVCVILPYIEIAIMGKHWIPGILFWFPVVFAAIFFEMKMMAWCAGGIAFVSIAGIYAYAHTQVSEERSYVGTFGVIAALVSVIAVLALNFSNYRPNASVAHLKESLTGKIDTMKYGEKDLPEGKIEEGIHADDGSRLTVTSTEKGKYYLKGYVGSVYEEGCWKPLEGKTYGKKYEGMFARYEKDGFHPLAQLYAYQQAAKEQGGLETMSKETDLVVENEGAYKKYIYVPYGVDFQSAAKTGAFYQDLNLVNAMYKNVSRQKNAYRACVTEVDPFLKTFGVDWNQQVITKETVRQYADVENDYRKFVYEYYRTLSDEAKEEAAPFVPEQTKDMAAFTETLRKLLKNAGEPENWDALHYASLGTLAFRSAGIPARYVEGYEAVTSEEPGEDGNYTADVTGQNAHAWVEIYCDGVGWLPIDVTPGHYDKIMVKSKPKQQTEKQQISLTQKVTQSNPGQQSAAAGSLNVWQLILKIIVVILCILLVTAAGFVIRRQYIYSRRKKMLLQGDAEEVYRSVISYLAELFSYLNISEEEMPADIQSSLQRYWFAGESGAGVTDREVDALQQYGQEVQQNMWQEASPARRIVIRFWYCFEFPFLTDAEQEKG